MDPNATLELINNAIADLDLCSAIDSILDLKRWIMRGGYTPDSRLQITVELLKALHIGLSRRSTNDGCQCMYCVDRRAAGGNV